MKRSILFTYPDPEVPVGLVRDEEVGDGRQDVHGAVGDLLDVALAVPLRQAARQHVGVADRLHLQARETRQQRQQWLLGSVFVFNCWLYVRDKLVLYHTVA